MGPEHKTYGYADNERALAPATTTVGPRWARSTRDENLANAEQWDWERMNDPELNQLEGTLAQTGEHDGCTNDYGVYDMVGNLHEWVDDPNGTFQGGYYQDTTINGEGCQYVTARTKRGTTTTRPASAAAPTSRPSSSGHRSRKLALRRGSLLRVDHDGSLAGGGCSSGSWGAPRIARAPRYPPRQTSLRLQARRRSSRPRRKLDARADAPAEAAAEPAAVVAAKKYKAVVHMGDSMVGGGLCKALAPKFKAEGTKFIRDVWESASIPAFDESDRVPTS